MNEDNIIEIVLLLNFNNLSNKFFLNNNSSTIGPKTELDNIKINLLTFATSLIIPKAK